MEKIIDSSSLIQSVCLCCGEKITYFYEKPCWTCYKCGIEANNKVEEAKGKIDTQIMSMKKEDILKLRLLTVFSKLKDGVFHNKFQTVDEIMTCALNQAQNYALNLRDNWLNKKRNFFFIVIMGIGSNIINSEIHCLTDIIIKK